MIFSPKFEEPAIVDNANLHVPLRSSVLPDIVDNADLHVPLCSSVLHIPPSIFSHDALQETND